MNRLLALTAAAWLSACVSTAPTSSPTDEIASQPPETASQIEPSSTPPDVTPSKTPPTATELTAEGPWLVVNSSQGLFAANADGSALTLLVGSPAVVAPHDLRAAVSPSGGQVALIYADPGVGQSLHLISLPGGEDRLIAELLPTQAEPSVPGLVDEVAKAFTQPRSLAWSPDGSQLAFVGAMNGPTADVYLYRVSDGSITQLTSGESQAYQLLWSPDGKYVLHAGVSSFGTGAGYVMEGVWAASADGSEVRTLYTPLGADERFVGWVTPTTFLVHSWDPSCGASDLRTFDIDSLREAPRFVGYFNEDGVALDAASGVVIYSIDEHAADCSDESLIGTFRFNLIELGVTRSTPQVARDIVFVPQIGAFVAATDSGALAIAPDGAVTDLPAPARVAPLVSPDGRFWAWASARFNQPQGLWVGEINQPPTLVFSDSVFSAAWSPDSVYVFFISDRGLSRVNANGTQLAPIASGPLDVTDPRALAWVLP